ncbi:lysosomal acid glucosylceramidase-like isoform X1 [Bactrocera neohumeralis]|uniref:lysosomal acid glucosylceramidase-like isoform X1 n=1 Tax=Bactrocera neohumeralis TaxID=98809 RepID=UPI0021653A87|nr:lysosomal acid glucosylceramidase-like isoform X1 [Bactrocera neohumeralis]
MRNAQGSLKNLLALCFLAGFVALSSQTSTPCALREYPAGLVCVCNATYCDYLENPSPENENEFVIVSSSKGGLRFDTTSGTINASDFIQVVDYNESLENATQGKIVFEKAAPRTVTIQVDREKHFQNITGFGGSFTGAVSYILDNLSQDVQDHIYKSFYSPHGIGFNLMRTSIGGSDFELAPWAYNELPENDTTLSNFTQLDSRDEKRIEQIKRLKLVTNVENLRIKAAAWSPPPWMKSNNKWTGTSRLKEEYYQTWADYHLRWIELWEKAGLPIWAISTGNEPSNGVIFMFFAKFMSLGWTPRKQAVWVSDNLGPTIRSKYQDLVIFGNDDQRYTFSFWFKMMKAMRSDSVDYLTGLSVHWYWDEIFEPAFIDVARKEMPDKIMLVTESCIGDKPWQSAVPILGSWKRGEKFARNFLQNLQHDFNGWIDWNIVLDEQGGPNYVSNFVDAPSIANMTSLNEFYKQPMFYTMGHFSKFIPEGSTRIAAERTNVNVDTVAFLRPDGSVVVVVFNSGYASVNVEVRDKKQGSIKINIPQKSIHTILYN